MRVYLPATISLLRDWYAAGQANADRGHAVTPALRESYRDGDLEELEWVAQQAAARDSLRLLAADSRAAPRRVVLAVDADDSLAHPEAGVVSAGVEDVPSAVALSGAIPQGSWASALVDDPATAFASTGDGATIAAAIDVARRGGGGPADPDGRDRLDDAEAIELGWWAIQELPALLH